MNARAHVIVSGRVTGVFFRHHTAELARRLGVRGWVRNTSDGRVEAMFEGDKSSVEEMVDFCKRGPPAAVVTGIEIEWEEYRGEFSGFEVRHGP
ncbi:MAG: acylphosphatase [Candidatus Hadarchaeales archaeon]